jgi:large subunit ribosomal protein L22
MANTAKHRFARISATKVRGVARMIQGMPVSRALETLEFSPKRGAKLLEKVLRSALANAGSDADPAEMVVQSVRIDGGPVAPGTKRFIPVSRGMAHPIRHRTSHIVVTIEHREAKEEQ